VNSHSPHEAEFYSPSVAPSMLDGAFPSSPPSEAESSRSVPPRMLLRYGDGRPDIPIAPMEQTRSSGRGRRQDGASRPPVSPPQESHYRARSGSHGSSPLARSYSRRPDFERSPPSPEEIRVLPSHGSAIPLSSSSSQQPRSKSLPRNADLHLQPEGFAPPLPTNQGPQVTFSQHQPQPWHTHSGRPHHPQKQPPSIIYAPSHHSRPHYSPPAIYHHPPQMGPNGMIYSHSAPVPQTQYPPNGGSMPYPSMPGQSSRPLASVHEESRGGRSRSQTTNHDRSRSLPLARPLAISPSASTSSFDSQGSGSTYYVLPAAGQKVHVIVSLQLLKYSGDLRKC
jgi:hypothetical protein